MGDIMPEVSDDKIVVIAPFSLTTTMHAILVKDGKGPVENLYHGEAPDPTPKAGQVVVKVYA